MKKYIKGFLKANGYKRGDFIPCFRCGHEAVDIDHIRSRGMGGSKLRDDSSNLQAVCRKYHDWKHGVGKEPCKEKFKKRMIFAQVAGGEIFEVVTKEPISKGGK